MMGHSLGLAVLPGGVDTVRYNRIVNDAIAYPRVTPRAMGESRSVDIVERSCKDGS